MALAGTILVVEDDVGVRLAVERFLAAAGFATVGYDSAEAMLAGGLVEGANCVVSDIQLPAMSGIELLDQLRMHGGWPPVVVITAHDSARMREQARRHGAVGYLAKPFEGAALLAAIASATIAGQPGTN